MRKTFVLIALFFVSEMADGGGPAHNSPNNRMGMTARNVAANSVSGLFDPSLTAMENADFILTPALLMQNAISEDKVILYPEQ